MATNQQLQNALDALNANPMFRLSMSSLELFHSNFLEWLFDLDHKAFLECFSLTVSNPTACTIKREYHLGTTKLATGKNKQWVTDIAVFENDNLILIIENKIKSTPSKGQLENQSKESDKKAKGCKKVLLSLFEYSGALHLFSQVLYKDLLTEIRKHYAQSNLYIKDYCDMLESLQLIIDADSVVQDAFRKNSTKTKFFTFHKDSPNLETCGIMDAFRKYQAASLADEFVNRFIITNPTTGMLCKKTGLPMTCEHSLNHKRACATIAYELNNGTLCVGVQVEQDQLRIFFENKDKEKSFNKDQIDQAQQYWKEWLGNPLGGGNKKQYCSYSNSFIYRYVKLESIITTDELCNRVEKLLGKISGKKDDIIKEIYETKHQ